MSGSRGERLKWQTHDAIDAAINVAAIVTVILGLSWGVQAFASRHRKPPPAPAPIVESTKIVDIRVYANSTIDYFLVVAGNDRCYVDRKTWLDTYVGQAYTCVWEPFGQSVRLSH